MESVSTAVSCGKAMLGALHRSALFDAESQDAVQRTLRLAAVSLDAPIAVLSIGDVDRQVLRAHVEPDACALPALVGAYADLMSQSYGRVAYIVDDARPVSLSGESVAPCMFAATPLALRESGELIGTLAVVDVPGRMDHDRIAGTLRDLAAGLVDQLSLRAENAGLRQKQVNLELQKQVFGLIAEGAPIDRILSSLASFIEHQAACTLCVIHVLGPDGRLRVVAAPTMPESLLALIDNAAPSADGCVSARAAFAGAGVVVTDMSTAEAMPCHTGMLEQGIQSMSSFPIRANGSVFGTIDLYHTHAGDPDDEQLHLISVASSAARIAIDRKRAEADLRSSEIYHRALIENASDYILVLAADGSTRYVSHRFAQAAGCAAGDLHRLTQVVVPEDRSHVDAFLSELVQSREQELEFRIRSADGTVRHILGTGTNLLADPAVRGLVINARDVTQQKLAIVAVSDSEERYRLVARASSDLIWDWDVAEGTLVWPARGEPVFGYQHAELPDDHDGWADLLHPEDRSRVVHGLDKALRDRIAATWSDEYRLRQGDGRYATVLDRGFIVRDDAGTAVRVIGSIMDLTTRRMLEEQLRQAQRMDAIGRLAGGVAHDFNNLLTVIEGFTAILLDELGTDGAHGTPLLEIQKASLRAAALTRQLLTFGRRQVLQPRLVDVNHVVRGVGEMLRRLIPVDINLETRLSEGELLVHADVGQLEQVILNLVINAREAVQQGGTIALRTEAQGVTGDEPGQAGVEPGEYIRLTVEDDGCGMDADVVSHIFEPFFTTKQSGTGLGLATVHGIVEQSGGQLRVDSSPGVGSTFSIYLPRSPFATGPAVVPDVTPGSGPAGHEVILLVEDDAAVRNLTHKLLARHGYHVFAADDGPSALAMISAGIVAPDLLLTDVVLPQMSGPIVAQRVTTLSPGTAVVFMSGYTDEQLGEHGVLSEEVAFLQKPFRAGSLLTLVREQLDGRTRAESAAAAGWQRGQTEVVCR